MTNFNIIEFKKDSAIYVAGQNPQDVFYIIIML